MSLKLPGKIAFTCLLGVLVFTSTAFADVIETNKSFWGRVTRIDDKGVSLKQGCDGSEIFCPWDKIGYVEINDICKKPKQYLQPSAIGHSRRCEIEIVYVIDYKDYKLFAESVFLDAETFRIDLVHNGGSLSGESSKIRSVRSIYQMEICKDKIPRTFPIPDGLKRG